ncbi:MAG: HAD-IB family hydrolase [Chlamydiae bacterium]|nr:HAD-IB family hydrolase [Chlamydiota bacterium]
MRFQRLSVFDLDETLIQGNASALFFRYLVNKGVVSYKNLAPFFLESYRYKNHKIDLEKLHRKIFLKYLYSEKKEKWMKHLPFFMSQLLPNRLYVPAFLKLKASLHMGHYTVILSNSPDFIVAPIAEFLKVHDWSATEYVVDIEGKFDKIGLVVDGKAKAQALRNLCSKYSIDRRYTYAYSDSSLDLELLEIAGHATAVNPERKLREISLRNGWDIL